jgi:two-component system, NtrC family, response regulator AtoC
MQLKADNFVLKPIDLQVLEAIVNKCLESLRAQVEVQYLKQKVSRLKGADQLDRLQQPQEVHHAIQLLAENSSTTVLILGETGTGKGMVANTIHALSDRRDYPLVDVNCAGLHSEFLESELFGHEKGAFTDAKSFKRGLLEVANRGSLFLDEIGEMSLPVQAKLLNVIENKTFRRLGGTVNIEVDVRIIAATNSNLEQAVKANRFRNDLYFRLNVIPVLLPPLRERREDILPLAQIFLGEFNRLLVKAVAGFSAEVETMLLQYSWPGNIRELKNVIERGVLLCDGNLIEPAQLPDNLRTVRSRSLLSRKGNYNLEALEKQQIEKALSDCQGNHSRAAQLLGIHRSTLIKKIKKYGLSS